MSLTLTVRYADLTKYLSNKLSCGETICSPLIAADLRPCADGYAVRTALVARQTDGRKDCGIA